jgi:preprotein translocase subunit SecD
VDKRPLIVMLTVSLLVVVLAGAYLGMGARPLLGLDLQGGISAVYEPELPEGEEEPDDFEEILDETIAIIRSRVDAAGVAEPDITRQGTNVLVQLPGVQEADRVQELIGRTAQLTFRPVFGIIDPGEERYDADPSDEAFDDVRQFIAGSEVAAFAAESSDFEGDLDDVEFFEINPDCDAPPDEQPELPDEEFGILCGAGDEDETAPDGDAPGADPLKYVVGPSPLSGSAIDDAFPAMDQQRGGYVTSLDLDGPGGEVFAQMTGLLACEPVGTPPRSMAIVLDNVVETSSPMSEEVRCNTGIRGGSAQISMGGEGGLQQQQQRAEDLALVLRTGALPISLEEATFQTVSPTLGADSLRAGLLAGLLGLILVGIWLSVFYRWLGGVALASLGVFGVLMLSLISFLGATIDFALTLAGVAGIIVAVGITADSSIIFFERIRDEVNLGKTVRTGVKRAFESAFRTNLAGNTVTLAAAMILYFLAVGPVRGFALMLGMATVLDVIILYCFTRPVVMLMGNTRLITRRSVRAREKTRAQAQAAAAGGAR